MENLYGMILTRLREICRDEDLPAFAAGQIARWLYVRRVQQVDAMTDLSRAAREKLARRFEACLTPPLRTSVSADGTKKYLFGSPDVIHRGGIHTRRRARHALRLLAGGMPHGMPFLRHGTSGTAAVALYG